MTDHYHISLSDLKLDIPVVLKLGPKSDTSPDIMTRPDMPAPTSGRPALNKKLFKHLAQPVLVVAEAKRYETGIKHEPIPNKPYYVVQIVMAAHASLILLLILAHNNGAMFDSKVHTEPLPADHYVSGGQAYALVLGCRQALQQVVVLL